MQNFRFSLTHRLVFPILIAVVCAVREVTKSPSSAWNASIPGSGSHPVAHRSGAFLAQTKTPQASSRTVSSYTCCNLGRTEEMSPPCAHAPDPSRFSRPRLSGAEARLARRLVGSVSGQALAPLMHETQQPAALSSGKGLQERTKQQSKARVVQKRRRGSQLFLT